MSKSGKTTKLGALLVAVGASACCWLPLLLVSLGVGATGVGAVFETLRPYLMAATVLLLGAAFYFTYRRKTACATDGACTTTGPSGRAKAMLWGVTAIAAVSFAFPYWSASRLADANADETALGAPVLDSPVYGMTCAACAVNIHAAVSAVPGVSAVKVDENPGRVRVWTESTIESAAVYEAIRSLGYTTAAPATRTAYIEVKGMVKQLGIT